MYVVSRLTGTLFLGFAAYMIHHAFWLLNLQQTVLSTNLRQPLPAYLRLQWGWGSLLIALGLLAFGLRLILKPVRLDQQI